MCADSHGASLSEKHGEETRAPSGNSTTSSTCRRRRGGTNTRQDTESTLAKGREAEGTILRGYLGARHDISACFPGPKPVQAEGLLK